MGEVPFLRQLGFELVRKHRNRKEGRLMRALEALKEKREYVDSESERVYLEIPFSEKDQVKEIGAWWDPSVRKWYVPGDIVLSDFAPWFPNKVLTLDLIPKGQWETNLRSVASPSEWNRIRRFIYEKSGNKCEICKGHGSKHPVECHEVWSYDEKLKVQRLTRLIALCPTCHKVKHWGRSEVVGENMRELREHMMTINDWTREMVDASVTYEFEVWNRRNKIEWTLNLEYVESIRASL